MFNIINNVEGSIGISTVILIIGILLVAATVGSVITEPPQNLTEEDINQLMDDVVKEISSYIQIKEVIGKFYPSENGLTIQKIILLVTPLCHGDFDLNDMIIQLQSKNAITTLYYNQHAVVARGNLFSEEYWNRDSSEVYSCLVTLDKDFSISQYDTLNEPSDMAYLTLNLPNEMFLQKGDKLTISMIPSSGVMRTIFIEAPLPMSLVVRL